MSLRFAVVGNCQARGFAKSLDLLVPGSTTQVLHAAKIAAAPSEQRAQWADFIAPCDVVFTQDFGAEFGALSTSALRSTARKVVVFPYLAFTGFHPDCRGIGGLAGPMGGYQSALIVAAYVEGLPEQRVAGLFNAFTYASLGWFDQLKTDGQLLVKHTARQGYDVRPFAELERGIFMHTPNHPRIEIIYEVARQAVGKADLAASVADVLPADELAEAVTWPIYPELADRMGVSAPFVYKIHAEELDLETFIRRSYACYHAHGLGRDKVATAPVFGSALAFMATEVRPSVAS